jgi:putative SOS response-associated peptidase YedK
MCFHSKQTKEAQEVQHRFKAKIEKPDLFKISTSINGFEHPLNPVITSDMPDTIQHFHWGLIPQWAQSQEIQKHTLNAKIETLAEKPSFQGIMTQRCLVLANGFYEWQWQDTKGKNKIKYQIGLDEEALFAFAGLYSFWKDPKTDFVRKTYTILTTEANELMSEIHNIKKRMPVILKPEDEDRWLSQAPIQAFAFPYQVDLLAQKATGESLTLW